MLVAASRACTCLKNGALRCCSKYHARHCSCCGVNGSETVTGYGEPPLKVILALALFAPPVHSSIRMRAMFLFSFREHDPHSALLLFLLDKEQVGAIGLIKLGNLQPLVGLLVSLVHSSRLEHIIDRVGENAQSDRTHQRD